MKYRMNQKVIVPENWTDKLYVCYGYIVGVEKIQNNTYLGYLNFSEYKKRFTEEKYKVIYESYNRATEKWYYSSELDRLN